MSLDGEIVVVSGLPRSGTSLMMQMLAAGGMEVVSDHQRRPDVDNPRGYWELEQVKRIQRDTSWIPQTRGKAFKMISQLLYQLPSTESYRIIFMQRDLDEVLASQEKMLARRNRPVAPQGEMRASFQLHLKRLFDWLEQQPNMQLCCVSYNALLDDPTVEAHRISEFLDGQVTADTMTHVVDLSLYRNRKASKV